MKYILTLVLLVITLIPVSAAYDQISEGQIWAFLYEFPLSWQNGRVVSNGTYSITTADAAALTPGSWQLVITDEARQTLRRYSFDPSSMAINGKISLIVPIEGRGATAYIADEKERRIVTIDLRWSRVCNDNGVCQADAGEDISDCPTDCGTMSSVNDSSRQQVATIVRQVSIGERTGAWILRLASGAAGVILLVGVVRMLDNRRRP